LFDWRLLMRRFAAVFLALTLIFGLCACGNKEEVVTERDCGLYITIEADDVYAVSYGTASGSESYENADKTALSVNDVVHFDFAGDAAEGTESCIIDYTVCIYSADLDVLATNSFSSDFASMAKIELTVTADHRIIDTNDKLVCGGDTVISFSTEKPETAVSVSFPNVSMPNRENAAKAINASIKSLNEALTGDQLSSLRSTYKKNIADAKEDAKTDSFSLYRYVSVARADSAVVSFKMTDKANLGTEKSTAVTGHNYNSQTGAELKLSDISANLEKLKSVCTEDIFSTLTDDSKYENLLFNEGYTDKLQELVSDGHWYLNSEGLVIAINPGEIAAVSKGAFEFTISYDVLADNIKEEYLPVKAEGLTGDITACLASEADTNGLTIVGDEADSDIKAVLVTVSGNIYNVTVSNATYTKSSGKYTIGSQIWYCSDLEQGAAFAINKELKASPNICVTFTRPDGTVEHRLLSISKGVVNVTDPDGGETGTVITSKLPYSVDINGDGAKENVDVQLKDKAATVTVGTASATAAISKLTNARLYDINSDGSLEVFIEGENADGDEVCYCFENGDGLTAVKFGDDGFAQGSIKCFNGTELVLTKSVDILGTYTAEAAYNYKSSKLVKSSEKISFGDMSYVTTSKELPLADGTILPADYKLKFTETDGSSYISFKTSEGLTGKIAIKKTDSGWTINGNADTSYFDSLPYAD